MIPKIHILVPVYGNVDLRATINSITRQEYPNFDVHICEDIIENSVREQALELAGTEGMNVHYHQNESGERQYALKNICRIIDTFKDDSIIGIVDGDDELIGNTVLRRVAYAYGAGATVVWTANQWVATGKNTCSGPFTLGADPYKHQWVASHFRTFPNVLYHKVNPENFLDMNGEWFKRTYDQALMLPILDICRQQEGWPLFVPYVCYKYTAKIEISNKGQQYQAELERFIRSRGYVE